MKFLTVCLLLILSANAAEKNTVPEYVHHGETITVTIEFWAHTQQPPYKLERFRPSLRIESEQRFTRATDFLFPAGYIRIVEESKERNLYFPDLSLFAQAAVVRGDDHTLVAHSGRRWLWPETFQLQDGDIVRVFEFLM